jgi:hypothetical protein
MLIFGAKNALVEMDVRRTFRPPSKKIGQRLLRTDVMRFQPLHLVKRFDRGRDRHKAVEAARIVSAIFVLCVAEHKVSVSEEIFRC